jgi:hypothetical protein
MSVPTNAVEYTETVNRQLRSRTARAEAKLAAVEAWARVWREQAAPDDWPFQLLELLGVSGTDY